MPCAAAGAPKSAKARRKLMRRSDMVSVVVAVAMAMAMQIVKLIIG